MIKMEAKRVFFDHGIRRDRRVGETFAVLSENDAERLERRRKAERVGTVEKPVHVDAPKPEAPKQPAEADDIAALRSTYETTVGKRPFMGWSAEDLKDKIGQYNRRDMRASD